MSLADVQESFLNSCLRPDPDAGFSTALPARRGVYRRLVRAGAAKAVREAFPVLTSFLPGEGFENLLTGFLAGGIRSRHYRDIAGEFFEFCREGGFKAPFTPALAELADFENARYALIFRENAMPREFAPLESPLSHAKPAWNPALVLGSYRHAVERARAGEPDTLAIGRTRLAIFRDPESFEIRHKALSCAEEDFIAVFFNAPGLTLADGFEKVLNGQNGDRREREGELLVCLRALFKERVLVGLIR